MITQERWVRSQCQMCYSHCAIRVRVRDGVADRIEGDPSYDFTRGRICARGRAGLLKLYDPHRIRSPLVRGNPRKGRGVDPEWRTVSWEEALELVGARMRQIRADDPNKLICGFWPFEKFILAYTWCLSFGTDNGQFSFTGVSSHCANAIHLIGNLTHGSQADYPDLSHCKYLLVLGTGIGATGFNNFTYFAQRLADARQGGMRLVVVDPRLSALASKADEWVPLVPGTDLALLLAMIHVVVTEERTFDVEFIRRCTNAPYLVDRNGELVRDSLSGKPLVWDEVRSCARAHDEEPERAALEGTFEVGGVLVEPAFSAMRRAFGDCPPERAAAITGISPSTIRRLAREFVSAAQIGAEISLGGRRYPLRPAAAISYRGLQAHTNGTLAAMALEILNAIVGSLDAVGGTVARSGDERRYGFAPPRLSMGADGLPIAQVPGFSTMARPSFPPRSLSLRELFPLAIDSGHLVPLVVLDPHKYGIEYTPEMLLLYHANPIVSSGVPETVGAALQKLFVVDITTHLDETAEYADVILPESTYLERHNLVNLESDGVGLHFGQPAVTPVHDTREGIDILIELARRAGCLHGSEGYYSLLNGVLRLCAAHRIDVEGNADWVGILDRWALCRSEGQHGLGWFSEHGHDMRERSPEERYRPDRWGNVRIPVYYNFVADIGRQLESALRASGYERTLGSPWDTSGYVAVPKWMPSPIHQTDSYDLYCVNYKVATITSSDSATNPWLMDVSARDAGYLDVEISREAARERGIVTGDRIRVESTVGMIEGTARVTDGLQRDTVAIAGSFGRWMRHPSVAPGGSHFNSLLPVSLAYTDKLSGSIETCARVRVTLLAAHQR